MRLGVLTGGGDVPGLNACIKAIVHQADARGWQVLGLRQGLLGLIEADAADDASLARWTRPLGPADVRTIDRTGGTILHTSRTDLAAVRPGAVSDRLKPIVAAGGGDLTAHGIEQARRLHLDALIVIGGDGTLRSAAALSQAGLPVISIPKTMDNDVFGTELCIGFSTAVTRSVDAVTALRTTAGSHERIAVIELFGRRSGETALVTGHLASADRVAIAESPVDAPALARQLAADRAANPSAYAICLVAEGAEIAGEPAAATAEPVGVRLARRIEAETGIGIIAQNLAYLMRSGPPDSLDRMLALAFGTFAVERLAQGGAGVMLAIRDGNYAIAPIDSVLKAKRRVDVARLYDVAEHRPRVAAIEGRPLFVT